MYTVDMTHIFSKQETFSVSPLSPLSFFVNTTDLWVKAASAPQLLSPGNWVNIKTRCAAAQVIDPFHTFLYLAALCLHELKQLAETDVSYGTNFNCQCKGAKSIKATMENLTPSRIWINLKPKTDTDLNWAIWALQSGSQSQPVNQWGRLKNRRHELIKFSINSVFLNPPLNECR